MVELNSEKKTIEDYLDLVPSLTLNTMKTKLIMHAFHSPDICHQNECLTYVTLQ